MISFNSLESLHNIIVEQHTTVQTAAYVTGYNIQYIRRLLRAGKLDGIKVGQVWLILLASLEEYIYKVESTKDRRCGPRKIELYTFVNSSN